MINNMNKEGRRSMNAYDPATSKSGKEPKRTPNKNRSGRRQSTDRLITKLSHKKSDRFA
jgi:hypothetical protein